MFTPCMRALHRCQSNVSISGTCRAQVWLLAKVWFPPGHRPQGLGLTAAATAAADAVAEAAASTASSARTSTSSSSSSGAPTPTDITSPTGPRPITTSSAQPTLAVQTAIALGLRRTAGSIARQQATLAFTHRQPYLPPLAAPCRYGPTSRTRPTCSRSVLCLLWLLN